MKHILTAILLVAVTGCMSVKDPVPTRQPSVGPPMPPGVTARQVRSVAPPEVSSLVVPAPITTNVLYMGTWPSGPYLWWLTNDLKNYVLTSTNLLLDLQQWEPLSVQAATATNGIASIPILNRTEPLRYYRLLSVPTNHIVFSWKYVFTTNTAGFKIYQGLASRAYTNTLTLPGQRLWSSYPVTATERAYYAVTAYDDYGVESVFSDEVNYQPGDVLTSTNRP